MFGAASRTLASLTSAGSLYPPLREIRPISPAIAFEVAKEAMGAGLADPCDEPVLRERIAAAMWEPRYLPYRPARSAMSRAETLRAVR
jgi:malate dehydrogenase (oxaloacetate-decarboxylating)